ncbi:MULTISPECIES: hypothetical protein [Vibrionaceae]|uniref:hypothetical protein n=1 Tax=Vibrionaceae TaxID=641 RepID=UPI00097FB209|nr:hypothetical protein [Vibrio campbellii]AQM71155.1 hypothetical protein Vca1114GL_04738 [Vibrio campbellii]
MDKEKYEHLFWLTNQYECTSYELIQLLRNTFCDAKKSKMSLHERSIWDWCHDLPSELAEAVWLLIKEHGKIRNNLYKRESVGVALALFAERYPFLKYVWLNYEYKDRVDMSFVRVLLGNDRVNQTL